MSVEKAQAAMILAVDRLMDMSQSLEAGYEHSKARVDAINTKLEATPLIAMGEPSEEMKAAQQKLDIRRKEVSGMVHSFSYLDCIKWCVCVNTPFLVQPN